jgi:TrmH family RNA methyltransferase
VSIDRETGLLEIRSAANDRFRRLLALADSARARSRQGQALLEGEHLALAWLATGSPPVEEVILPRRSLGKPGLEALCRRIARTTLIFDDSLFDRLSQVEHGPGPVFVLPVAAHRLKGPIDTDCVYLDGLQDPGNAGTLLRSVAAFGLKQILASPSTVDLWSPKVARAAMGAHFQLQIVERVTAGALIAALGKAILTAAEPRAERSIEQASLTVPRIWLFGSEGAGLSPELSSRPEVEHVRIAHHGHVESLNVAVAASICLYEQARQRAGGSRPSPLS